MTKARKCVIDNITFDSRSEGRRYQELKYRQLAGEISELRAHPAYIIIPAYKEHPAVRFTADFLYQEGARMVIEDVKPFKRNKRGERVPFLARDFVVRWKLLQYTLRQFDTLEFRITEG